MDEFIARLNIEHFRKLLVCEHDSERLRLISDLLAKEEGRLAAIERQSSTAGNNPVSHLNLMYYRERLDRETDMVIRQILIRLINEEEARGAPAAGPARKTFSGE